MNKEELEKELKEAMDENNGVKALLIIETLKNLEFIEQLKSRGQLINKSPNNHI